MNKKHCNNSSLKSILHELHQIKNNNLDISKIVAGSKKVVWWQCNKGHEWEAMIQSRALQGTGCPYCSGQKVSFENSLKTNYPMIAKEWCYEKNGILTPDKVTKTSGKKVWWKCKSGHVYEAVVAKRTSSNHGCHICSNRFIIPENSLQGVNPELVKEWHPTKNKIAPNTIAPNAKKKVWWLCAAGHEWNAQVYQRNIGSKCPYCSSHNSIILPELSFAIKKPNVAKFWHPTKNRGLSPLDVRPYANKKVWWLCSFGHSTFALIKNRTAGNGCEKCWREYQTGKTLWESLSQNSTALDSPEWHGEVLKERDIRLAEGKEKSVDWTEAKDRIRKSIFISETFDRYSRG